MAILTSEEKAEKLMLAVESQLPHVQVMRFFDLWPQDPQVFGTSVVLSLKTVDSQPFGQFSVHRPSQQSPWGTVDFLVATHVLTLDHIHKFQLQIGIIHEMLRKINEG